MFWNRDTFPLRFPENAIWKIELDKYDCKCIQEWNRDDKNDDSNPVRRDIMF